MRTKTKYFILYFLISAAAPLFLLTLLKIFLFSRPELSYDIYYFVIGLQLISGFFINYWYAQKIAIRQWLKITLAIFNIIGFFYLMGYNMTLISYSEIVKQSWNLYKKGWKKIWVYLLMLLVPTLALSALSTISLYLSVYIPSSTMASEIIILFVFAASLVFAVWTSIALVRALKEIFIGQEPKEWKTNFSESSGLIMPIIYTSILVFLIILGGTILLIIPGIIFSVWYAFTFYTVIFEDKRGFKSLSASKSLTVGRWWAIVWRLIAPGLIFGILGALLSFVVIGLVDLIPMDPLGYAIAERIMSAVVNVAITPLSAAAILILYLSAKNNPSGQ